MRGIKVIDREVKVTAIGGGNDEPRKFFGAGINPFVEEWTKQDQFPSRALLRNSAISKAGPFTGRANQGCRKSRPPILRSPSPDL
jgi:hypothetical protein